MSLITIFVWEYHFYSIKLAFGQTKFAEEKNIVKIYVCIYTNLFHSLPCLPASNYKQPWKLFSVMLWDSSFPRNTVYSVIIIIIITVLLLLKTSCDKEFVCVYKHSWFDAFLLRRRFHRCSRCDALILRLGRLCVCSFYI